MIIVIRGLFFLTFCLAVLSACTQTPAKLDDSARAETAMGRSAIVSMGSPNLNRAKPSAISWADGIDVIGQREGMSNEFLQQEVQTAVQNQIMQKGYQMISGNGDFQLHATLVLAGNNDDHTLLRQTGGIDPGLIANDRAAGKGSLILELRQGHAMRWRGAVQIYLLPESDINTAAQRIQYAVAQLLLTWP